MPDRTTYRQASGEAFGLYHAGTAKLGSSAQVLRDSTWPVKSTTEQDDRFDSWWIARPEAASANDLVRQVVEDGYTPGDGDLFPDLDWDAPWTVGEAYELHGVCPPDQIHSLINEALKLTWVKAEIACVPTADVTRHSISQVAPWMQSEGQLRKVGSLTTGETRNAMNPFLNPFHGEVFTDAGTIYIDHYPHIFNPTTDTIYLEVVGPAYHLCRASSAGVYGDREGLAAEAHEAIPPAAWVAEAVLMLYWDHIARVTDGETRKSAVEHREEHAAVFSSLTDEHFRTPVSNIMRRRYWGPPHR